LEMLLHAFRYVHGDRFEFEVVRPSSSSQVDFVRSRSDFNSILTRQLQVGPEFSKMCQLFGKYSYSSK
jgi:hypothetical protein